MPTAHETYPQSSDELLLLLQARDAEVGVLKLMIEKLKLNPADYTVVNVEAPEMVAALLGTLKAGAAYVPLEPRHPAERRTWMTEDSGTSLVIDREGWHERPDIRIHGLEPCRALLGLG